MDTYNLAAYSTPEQLGIHTLEKGFQEVPSINFGGSKLIARFAQLLLTLKGSDKTDPNAGCGLLAMLGTFHTSEVNYLRSEVNKMIGDVAFQMEAENDPAVIPESIFISATCENIDITGDTVHLHISIMTAANTKLQFVLPMPIV